MLSTESKARYDATL